MIVIPDGPAKDLPFLSRTRSSQPARLVSSRSSVCVLTVFALRNSATKLRSILLHVKFDDGIASVVYTCSSTRFVYRDYRQTRTNRGRSFFAVYLSTVAIFWAVKVFEQRPIMLFRLI